MSEPPRTTADRLSVELNLAQDLNLKHLYYFHCTATEGTIASAAKRLGLGSATISEQLKSLEDYLGRPLLERRSTGVRLTQEGRRLFEHTSTLFRAVHRMLQDISPERYTDRWTLELGLCPSISRTMAVRRFLPLFKFESVKLRVRQGSYEDLMEDLLSGEIDIVISENQPTESERKKVDVNVVVESPLVFVASPKLAEQVQDYPADLGKLPLLSYSQTSRYRREVDHYLYEAGVSSEIMGEVDDAVLLAAAAEQGICYAATPRSVVQEQLEEGRLVELGRVNGSSSHVYALFQSVKTPEIVLQAIDALVNG